MFSSRFLLNTAAFLALVVVYCAGSAGERPPGVRRAMQTYSRELTSTCSDCWPIGDFDMADFV